MVLTDVINMTLACSCPCLQLHSPCRLGGGNLLLQFSSPWRSMLTAQLHDLLVDRP